MECERTYTAFAGWRRIVRGDLRTMLLAAKSWTDRGQGEPLHIFDEQTGQPVDFDFRGTPEEVVQRATPSSTIGPGRPRLGVVSREVSLLPRHWEWLEAQPNGISAALRRLVEEARKREPGRERTRRARDAAASFMWAIGGDLPHFEEASRALYAGDPERLRMLIRTWPEDVREQVMTMLNA